MCHFCIFAAKHFFKFLLFLLFSASVSAAIPQDHQHKIKVTYQLTDVKVWDEQGNFVQDLNREDFLLLIDGKEVEVKSLDEAVFTSLPQIDRQQKKPEASDPKLEKSKSLNPPRFVVIILDRGNLGNKAFANSKILASKFVREVLQPEDKVALFMFNNSVRYLAGPTTNKEKILKAIETANAMNVLDLYLPHQFEVNPIRHLTPNKYPEDDRPVRKGNINDAVLKPRNEEMQLVSRNYFTSLKILSKAFRSMPDKKSIIIFSEGFHGSTGFGSMDPDLQRALNSFNSGSTSIYGIVRGPSIPEYQAGNIIEQSRPSYGANGSQAFSGQWDDRAGIIAGLSYATNGKFYNRSLKDEAVINSLRFELGDYYLLGFSPPATNGKEHSIKISVKNHPEYTVRFRRSFVTQKRFDRLSSKERDIHLEEGFLTPGFHNQFPLRIFTNLHKKEGLPHVALAVTFPKTAISEKKRAGYELELVINVEDAKGQIRRRIHKIYRKDQISCENLKILENFSVIQEPFAIYLAIRDNVSAKRSTWSKTIYPKKNTYGSYSGKKPFDDSYDDLNKWKVKHVKDGVPVLK